MTKKHASNEKVKEQLEQAKNNAVEGVNIELKAMFDGILVKINDRKLINDSIREDVARINKKWGVPAKTSRRIIQLLTMDKEAMAQMEHSLAETKRLLGMQNDLFLIKETKVSNSIPQISAPNKPLPINPIEAAMASIAH